MIQDLVTIIDNYCVANDINYHYGTQKILNLIDRSDEFTGSGTYFLHDINRVESLFTSIGKVRATRNTGQFMLVIPNALDEQFYNESNSENDSKYKDLIQPLTDWLNAFQNSFACSSVVSIQTFSRIPVTDVKDINFDGWLVNYVIEIQDDAL